MTAPTPIDLYGVCGSTLVVDLTLTRRNAQGQLVPVDLTGASLWMTMKYRYVDPDPGVAQASTTGGGIVINTPATAGLATATFDPSVTAGLAAPLSLVYDVKVRESSGVESTPIRGLVILAPAATLAG